MEVRLWSSDLLPCAALGEVILFEDENGKVIMNDDGEIGFLPPDGSFVPSPAPSHRQECYGDWNNLSFPVTEKIHREELSLPMSPAMTDDEAIRVAEAVNSFR